MSIERGDTPSLQLQSANLRNVRAGGDRRQPRILQYEPVLPRARRLSTPGQTKAQSLLIAIYLLLATLPKDTCERPTAWLRMQSAANQSPHQNSLLTGKLIGNFPESGL